MRRDLVCLHTLQFFQSWHGHRERRHGSELHHRRRKLSHYPVLTLYKDQPRIIAENYDYQGHVHYSVSFFQYHLSLPLSLSLSLSLTLSLSLSLPPLPTLLHIGHVLLSLSSSFSPFQLCCPNTWPHCMYTHGSLSPSPSSSEVEGVVTSWPLLKWRVRKLTGQRGVMSLSAVCLSRISVSLYMNKWMSEWMSEWVNEWINGRIEDILVHDLVQ